MTSIAHIEVGQIISVSLIAVIVPIALRFLYRSGQRGSEIGSAGRIIDYPRGLKALVCVFWIVASVFAALVVFTAKGDEFWLAHLGVLLFAGMILPLHLEAYFVRITWDDLAIRTSSPWRRSRIIPIASVIRCDFSQSMQWYRIHTEDSGIVRLHVFAQGIPQLLDALPVPHPGYPPNQKA